VANNGSLHFIVGSEVIELNHVSLSKLRPKKNNLVFKATVLKTLGRVGSAFFFKN